MNTVTQLLEETARPVDVDSLDTAKPLAETFQKRCRREKPKTDLTGQRFHNWTVVSWAKAENGGFVWNCVCDCGTKRTIKRAATLTTGHSASCGCAANIKHGKSRTLTYRSWHSMISRTTDSKHIAYSFYGGRGIVVCDRWLDFEVFFSDVGERPSKDHTLDRYPDKDGNYEPGNVRWATRGQQQNNKRDNVLVTINGQTQTATEAARLIGVSIDVVYHRLKAGYSEEMAFSKTNFKLMPPKNLALLKAKFATNAL